MCDLMAKRCGKVCEENMGWLSSGLPRLRTGLRRAHSRDEKSDALLTQIHGESLQKGGDGLQNLDTWLPAHRDPWKQQLSTLPCFWIFRIATGRAVPQTSYTSWGPAPAVSERSPVDSSVAAA